MSDYNQILTPGDIENFMVNVVVEIPSGSTNKIEWNREMAIMTLDRVEPAVFAKPTNYGFIPQTLDEDGDELDAIILTDEPLPTGLFLKAKIIGVMKFEDEGQVDDKILVVPDDSFGVDNNIKSIDHVPELKINQIADHFNNYKNYRKPGCTKVKGWGNENEAKDIITRAIDRWNNR
jgi:inorganic pyrophosphatase